MKVIKTDSYLNKLVLNKNEEEQFKAALRSLDFEKIFKYFSETQEAIEAIEDKTLVFRFINFNRNEEGDIFFTGSYYIEGSMYFMDFEIYENGLFFFNENS